MVSGIIMFETCVEKYQTENPDYDFNDEQFDCDQGTTTRMTEWHHVKAKEGSKLIQNDPKLVAACSSYIYCKI